ncbi:MAG: ketoacyl-ACP synthase III [Acidobacteria bacterium]|nr:ketoacyl-ACP synthase III [Acidobacteriota bacterium]
MSRQSSIIQSSLRYDVGLRTGEPQVNQTRPVRRAKISALGCYVPPRLLTNEDLEKMVDTSSQWILERTGIHTRHIAGADQATSDMAVEAARATLAERGLDAAQVQAILVCTVTPDMFFPSTACLVQDRIGAKKAWGFDLVAACSGFVYGLTAGAQMVAAGVHDRVLVIGADTMSRIIDYTDRATCVLFGDGAGAMLLEPAESDGEGLVDFIHEVDGSGGQYLYMPAGGSRCPASHETVDQRQHFVHQDGQQVFKFAVRKMHEVCKELLERNGLSIRDVDVMLPHQANRRIITAASERLGIPCDRVIINIDRFGNTTAATIPLAAQDAREKGLLKPGKLALIVAVGAGYTVGASLWRWAY